MTTTKPKNERYQNAAHRLQADAYHKTCGLPNGKRGGAYIPCAKAAVYVAACKDPNSHPGTVTLNASLTPCGCHNSASFDDLLDMEYDDTYRLAHYAGGTWKLYRDSVKV
jgi:hypothetical protein